MAAQTGAKQVERYKHTARARWRAERNREEARRERAWQLAHQAAKLLREKYDVRRIMVFGSLVQSGRFTLWSDVDLAAWGLTPANWLKAMAAVRDLSSEVELNLVDVATSSPELLAAIEQGGVLL